MHESYGGPSGSLRYLDAPIVLCMGKRGSGPKLLTMHFPFPACEKIIWLFFVHFLPEIQMLRLAGSPYSTGSILLFWDSSFFQNPGLGLCVHAVSTVKPSSGGTSHKRALAPQTQPPVCCGDSAFLRPEFCREL